MVVMAKEGRIRTAAIRDGVKDRGTSRQSVYFCLAFFSKAALSLDRQ
jgi:hypothetical protein